MTVSGVMCPDRTALQGALLGRLPDTELVDIERHLEQCGHCLDLARNLSLTDDFLAAMQNLGTGPLEDEQLSRLPIVATILYQADQRAADRKRLAERSASDSTTDSLNPTILFGKAGATAIGLDQQLNSNERFQILKPHAQGGLGKVSVALDRELNREVALKEILPAADSPDNRRRFLLEAEVTGALEHPGIVPVYAMGKSADGRPYYAMRFVQGDSLTSSITDYHDQGRGVGTNPGTRALALRKLLTRFIDVCNAVNFAHNRGVIHRDLKPANIMVGKYGETLVVDWGLAKAIGKNSSPDDSKFVDESIFRPSSAMSTDVQTMAGSAAGTPAYMSPEQASGKLDELGPATDIYSLGATLFHIVCGQPPFGKKPIVELLKDVIAGRFSKPSIIQPALSRSLEAICLRAMATSAADRYPTARALADDVEHWLADEPVSAYREITSERVSRWSRKHRTWVHAGMLAVLLLSIVSTVAAVWINSERAAKDLLATQKSELATQKSELATKMSLLADEKTNLATKNLQLAEAEKKQAGLAESRSRDLQRTLAQQHFAFGIAEYDAGREEHGLQELQRSLALAQPASLLEKGLGQVLPDRLSRFGRLILPPIPFESGSVEFVQFSPDGRLLLIGGGRMAMLIDGQTGVQIGRSMEHGDLLRTAAFSPDGSRILTCSWDRTVRLWSGLTGQPTGKVMVHPDRVFHARFSPDGKRIVTAAGRETRMWDGLEGTPLGPPVFHEANVASVEFNADGTLLATGAVNRQIRICDGQTGLPLGTPILLDSTLIQIMFSRDGQRLISSSMGLPMSEPEIRIWDPKTSLPLGATRRHRNMRILANSPVGERFATADFNTVMFWDSRTGAPAGQGIRHDDRLSAVAFSPDGTSVASGSIDRTLRIWDSATGTLLRPIAKHEQEIHCLAFSPDGTRLAVGTGMQNAFSPGCIYLWDATESSLEESRFDNQRQGLCLGMNPDGSRVFTGLMDGTGQVWDRRTGTPVGAAIKHQGWIRHAFFTRDGRRLATATGELINNMTTELHLSDAETGLPLCNPIRQGGWTNPRFSADGTRVLTEAAVVARIWDVRTGAPLIRDIVHPGFNIRAEFNHDESQVLTGYQAQSDRTARLWDARTGTPIDKQFPLGGDWMAAAFSPDGSRLVIADSNGAKIWDLKTSKPIGVALPAPIEQVTFSPDSSLILTCGGTAARIWDGFTGLPQGTALSHVYAIQFAIFSPDGRIVATAGGELNNLHSVRLWDASSGAQLGEPFSVPTRVLKLAFHPDGKDVLVMLQDRVQLRAASLIESPQHLNAWTELMTRQQLDGSLGQLKPITNSEWLIRWNQFQESDADWIRGESARRAAGWKNWHRQSATRLAYSGQWFGAKFHAQQVLRTDPNNSEFQTLLERANEQLKGASQP